MFNIKKQISGLYLSSILGNLSLTGAWVAILAARGYSLVEIGIAETIFHITSLICEIPSGVLADMFGRKNMLIISNVMRMIGSIIMIFSYDFFMICICMAFFAMSYNFSSGSGDALAYDSLKIAKSEIYFEKYSSNQIIIYRICNGLSTLCAGLALFIGYKAAYFIDILMGAIQMFILAALHEVCIFDNNNNKNSLVQSLWKEFANYFTSSILFLKNERKAIFLMFCNSFVGTVDILLLFFLQAKLSTTGISDYILGIALFIMECGGIFGAKVILKIKGFRYRNVFAVAATLVLFGVVLEHSGVYFIMTLGGFIAAFSDDALQVRTNAILQDMFPSEQRATLISIESFTFSVLMILMSPLAGILFSRW